jgi:L-alanine-DL-glutamate epimerase-like enolase superfamily enzyme
VKLERWALHFYRLPYRKPVVWSNAEEDAGLYALLTLAADGLTGIAEGTIKNTWSGVSPASLRAALEGVVLPLLGNVDLLDEHAVYKALSRIPENRLAKGLVDNACWTLRALHKKLPLWKLLGGSQDIEVCWTVTRDKPAAMAKESADYCGRYGFRMLKVKGGQEMKTDLEALAAIRSAVGPGVSLTVDANSAFTRDEAPGYVKRIAEAGAIVAEDPSPLAPDAQFEALQKASPVPILVDGSCTSARDAALYLARGVQAVSLKPGRVGISESMRVKETVGPQRQTALGIYAESALGTLVNLQLPASMPAEQSFFLVMDNHVAPVPQIRGGRIVLPQDPDLHKLIDWKAVKRFEV